MATTATTVFVLCCVNVVFGASVYQQADIKKTRKRDTRNDQSNDSTFVTESIGRDLQKNGNPIFNRVIDAHKGIFLDSIAHGITFHQKMKNIYELRKDKWTLQKDAIVHESRCDTSDIRKSESVEQFYKNITKLYTRERDCIYRDLNAELRNYTYESENSNGTYALTLNVILSQWKKLKECIGTTYHGVKFSPEGYTGNTVFTWTGFTSSSKNKTVACDFAETAIFAIDNSASSDWRPRSIAKYSHRPNETECLYPATAIFKVIRTKDPVCEDPDGTTKYVTEIYISLQRGETEDSDINGAVIFGRSLGGVAYLTLFAVVIAM